VCIALFEKENARKWSWSALENCHDIEWGYKKIKESLGEGPRFVVLNSTQILPYKN
jgi:hypothetical protein